MIVHRTYLCSTHVSHGLVRRTFGQVDRAESLSRKAHDVLQEKGRQIGSGEFFFFYHAIDLVCFSIRGVFDSILLFHFIISASGHTVVSKFHRTPRKERNDLRGIEDRIEWQFLRWFIGFSLLGTNHFTLLPILLDVKNIFE